MSAGQKVVELNDVDTLRNEVARLEKLVYVPGLFKCEKCKFSLISTTLNVSTGQACANNVSESCPNGCGPLRRVTEREAGNESVDRLDAAFNNGVARALQVCEPIYAKHGPLMRKPIVECLEAIDALKLPPAKG